MEPENAPEWMREPDESEVLITKAFEMTLPEFVALKVADRDVIVFALLRQLSATMQHLAYKVDEYERKAKEMMTPDGIEEMKKKAMDALGMGDMFRGMF